MKHTAALMMLLVSAGSAAAQDVRGLEACMAEKQIERRTGCLQANAEFLQQEMVKLKRETQAQLAAAKAESKAQIDALKAALTKVETELTALKDKPEPAAKK